MHHSTYMFQVVATALTTKYIVVSIKNKEKLSHFAT